MKKFFSLLFLLIPLLVSAKDILVPVGSDITPYVAQAASGDNIILSSGNYSISGNAMLKPQVNFTGAGIDKTYISNYTWLNSGQPALAALNLQGGDGKGQIVQGFTLYGDPSRSSEGILVEGRNNVILQNIKVQNFFYSGIELRSYYEKTMSGITLQDFVIKESSKESGAGSFGNLILRGDLLNILIQKGTIEAMTNNNVGPWGDKGSGYCIKGFSNYRSDFSKNEVQKNVRILYMIFKSKTSAPWGGNVPNFNCEWWKVSVEEFEIAFCKFNQQLSLEYALQKAVARSFWVHDNDFNVEKGQSIELTARNAVVEKNKFFFANNTGWCNVFGTYNSQKSISDIVFRNNEIDAGKKSVLIAYAKGQYVNLLVENNQFVNGSFEVIKYVGKEANGSTVNFRNNTWPAGTNQISYVEGAQSAAVSNTLLNNGNQTSVVIPTPVITTPTPNIPAPITPIAGAITGPFAVISPTNEALLTGDTEVKVNIGSTKAATLTIKLLTLGTLINKFELTQKITSPVMTVTIPARSLQANTRYLVEVKTIQIDGYSVVNMLYVPVRTNNVTTPVLTPTPTPTPILVDYPVMIKTEKTDSVYTQSTSLGNKLYKVEIYIKKK